MTSGIDVGLLMLRLAIGLTMAAHGYAKIFRGGRLTGTASWFESIGMRPGRLHAPLAALTELGGGLLFAFGLVTPLAAASIVALMFVAAWTVHRGNGFFIVGNGWEYNLILAVVAVSAAAEGAGRISVDHLLGAQSVLHGWPALLIAVIVGLGGGVAQVAVFFRPPALVSPPRSLATSSIGE
jgi:putative oxidoreductase